MQRLSGHTNSTLFIKLHNFCLSIFIQRLEKIAPIFLLIFISCINPGPEERDGKEDSDFAYDLENPDYKYKLPSFLEEISGLSYYGKGKIACVQDEKANIYILDLEKEKIINKYDFGEDGDYEDIAIVNKTAYVLKNNGHIYRIEDFKKKDRKIKKYNTPLKEKNDTEGIAFDHLSNGLLIACKGSPSIEKENLYEGYKAVYRFDLEEKEMDTSPIYLVDLERLDSYIDRSAFMNFSVKVAKRLRLVESETSFHPSGIAIHPISSEIFMISSVGKLLIVLSRSGKVKDVRSLDPKIFRQPEGICFSPGGELYISNEGQGGKGYILYFKPHE